MKLLLLFAFELCLCKAKIQKAYLCFFVCDYMCFNKMA